MVTPMTIATAYPHEKSLRDLTPSASLAARPEPLAYRIQDACYMLGIGRTSLYELVKAGELKLIKIAGRTLVPRSEIERLTRVEDAA